MEGQRLFDYNNLKRKMVEQKVFDSWKYVESIREYLQYTEVSYSLLEIIYEHRNNTIHKTHTDMFEKAIRNPGHPVPLMVEDLNRTNLEIAGYEFSDVLLMKKTTLEFFHYSRVCTELVFQLLNAALLGDDAFNRTDSRLKSQVMDKLKDYSVFSNLLCVINSFETDDNIKYLKAIDNYTKHIETVEIDMLNNLLSMSDGVFEICEFYYKGEKYEKSNVLDMALAVLVTVRNYIRAIMESVYDGIEHCVNNRNRVYNVSCKQVFTGTASPNLKYSFFFIEVDKDISELPNTINVFPVKIHGNEVICDEISNERIFVSIKGGLEAGVIGCAKKQEGELGVYKKYVVEPCRPECVFEYIKDYWNDGRKVHIKPNAYEYYAVFLNSEE